jgi:glutathione S-transferase
MKLYNENDPAPNPRRVRIFMKEKGIEIPLVHTPIPQRAHKSPEHMQRNPLGQLPVLELDDGTCISESVSICRYLEDLHPQPNMFGRDPKERALIDMWTRRVEFRLMQPLGQVWVHTHPFTATVAKAAFGQQFQEFGKANLKVVASGCELFDRELGNRAFIAGDRYTIADITAQSTFDFARFIGVDIPETCTHMRAWYERVSARPSAAFEVPEALLQAARGARG